MSILISSSNNAFAKSVPSEFSSSPTSESNNSGATALNNPLDRILAQLDRQASTSSQTLRYGDQIDCENSGYFGNVLLPFVRDTLPNADTTAGRTLNHLTNVYGLFTTISADLCDGKISEPSARAAGEFIARSTASAVSILGGAKLTLLGAVFGPAGAVGGLAVTGFLLKTMPDLAAKINTAGFNLFNDLIGRTKQHVKTLRAG